MIAQGGIQFVDRKELVGHINCIMLALNVITIRQSQGVPHANRCPPETTFSQERFPSTLVNCEEPSTNRDRKRWREFVSARGRAGRKRERGAQYSS
jgi:hypothetical protein